ncbi:flagellar hook capping protein [Paenibacillus sp. ACRRX]|uniref:flagellar hook capping FlgD N-terminal domain-containing protein n=1 Tax=unclassified Paenibacillus TaxID=185978 RepID=UPI001EF6843D|nr:MULTISPECIES: flagellar hook capping FlgD N-terminal domain-containing protein [unclassified Paenibacillus]MCG7407491.1 flagellar hook capping protein [Paenibacillus sp. ACRRX]MDK8180727.1 flagellar hook capping FlgD N-terminal domain-containing protein [Paenibacillus sp. UMB4589-SE434]
MTANAGVVNSLLWPNYSKENLDRLKPTGEMKQLGKDDFLKILITQLSNQDPTQPLQDKDFIAQMAQFTSVEQLTNISSQLNFLQQSLGMSSNLIGKEISWIAKDQSTGDGSGETVVSSGVVDSIVVRANVPYAKVGDAEVELKDITEIKGPHAESGGNGANANAGAAVGAGDKQ